MNADGTGARRIYATFGVNRLSWSPDGRSIAMGVHWSGANTGNHEIFVIDVDGTNLRNLTASFDRDATEPAWSPDGQSIAFGARDSDTGDLMVMDADGTNPRVLISADIGTIRFPAWSPTGSKIAYSAGDYGRTYLYVANADGSGIQQLTIPTGNGAVTDLSPAWSRTGSQIAFSRDQYTCVQQDQCGRTVDVYVLTVKDRSVRRLTDGARSGSPTW